MYYINALGLKQPVYKWREYSEENFNPMALHIMYARGDFKNCVQVYIDVVGGQEWVNVRREWLIDFDDPRVERKKRIQLRLMIAYYLQLERGYNWVYALNVAKRYVETTYGFPLAN